MVFFDKFKEECYEVDNQELEIGPTTVSEIKERYSELGVIKVWTLGEQTANREGQIISRTYRKLNFSSNALDFDLVDAGYTDNERYKGRYYWRVLHEFKETEYYSSHEVEFKNFKIWEKSINEFQMEITYDNLPTKYINENNIEIESIFNWEREITKDNFIGGICPNGVIEAELNETGPSIWKETGNEIEPIIIDNVPSVFTECYRYNSVPTPFFLVLDAGKSLGATFSNISLAPTTVYISKNRTLIEGEYNISEGLGTVTNPHKMSNRYLIIKWDNAERETLTKLTITFRGNEIYRSFLPLLRDNEPECPEHLDITPYLAHVGLNTPTRYKPPGEYNFPDNFWNDIDNIEITNYAERITINPSII